MAPLGVLVALGEFGVHKYFDFPTSLATTVGERCGGNDASHLVGGLSKNYRHTHFLTYSEIKFSV